MGFARTVSMFCLFGLIQVSGVSMAEQIFLDADFNDKEIDEPIGNGCPALGEPRQIPGNVERGAWLGPGEGDLPTAVPSQASGVYCLFRR